MDICPREIERDFVHELLEPFGIGLEGVQTGVWAGVWVRPEVRRDGKKEGETTNCTNSKYCLDRENCEPSFRIENMK